MHSENTGKRENTIMLKWSYPDSVDRLGLSPPALR